MQFDTQRSAGKSATPRKDTVVVSTSMTKAHPHGGNRSRKFRLHLLRCSVLRAFRHNPDLIGGCRQRTVKVYRWKFAQLPNIVRFVYNQLFIVIAGVTRGIFGCARVSQLDEAKSQRDREKWSSSAGIN